MDWELVNTIATWGMFGFLASFVWFILVCAFTPAGWEPDRPTRAIVAAPAYFFLGVIFCGMVICKSIRLCIDRIDNSYFERKARKGGRRWMKRR